MKLKVNGLLPALAALGLVLATPGCSTNGDSGSPNAPNPWNPPVWEVTSLSSGLVLDLAVNNIETLVASVDGDGIYLSTTNGDSWTKIKNGPFQGNGLSGFATCLAFDGNTLWAGTEFAGIHRTLDEGETWTEVPGETVPVEGLNDLGPARDSVFCAADNGIFVLTSPEVMRRINETPAYALCGDRFSTHLYVGTGIFWNNGGSATILWSPEKYGGWYSTVVSNGAYVKVIAQAPNGDLYAGCYPYGGMVMKDGQYPWWSWEHRNTETLGEYSMDVQAIAATEENTIYATQGHNIMISRDKGYSWENYGLDSSGRVMLSLMASPSGYLFAGTDQGVIRTPY